MVKDKTKIICSKDDFNVHKLQNNLLVVSKLLLIGLKCGSKKNEFIVRGPDGRVIAMGLLK